MQVAALYMDLGIRVNGANEATRALHGIAGAQEALQAATGHASAEVRTLGHQLAATVSTIEELTRKSQGTAAALQAIGTSTETVASDLARMKAETEAATGRLANMQAELALVIDRMSEVRVAQAAATQEFGAQSAQAQALSAELKTLMTRYMQLTSELTDAKIEADSATKAFAAFAPIAEEAMSIPVRLDKATADGDKLVRTIFRLTGAQEANTRAGLMNQTMLTGLVSALRSGNVGSAVLGNTIQFLTSKMGVLAIAAGAVVISMVQWATKVFQMADAINGLRPEVLGLAQDLQNLEGVDLVGLGLQIEGIQNRFAALGASDVNAIAKDIATMGASVALLNSVAGDSDQAISAVSRALETLDFQGLTQFSGELVFKLNETMRAMEGMGEASKRAAAREIIAGFLAQKDALGLLGEQAGRERNTFDGLKKEAKDMWNSIAQNEHVRQAIAQVIQSFRAFIKAMEPVIAIVMVVARLFIWLGEVVILGVASVMALLARAVWGVLNVLDYLGANVGEARDAVKAWTLDLESTILGQEKFESSLQDVGDEVYNFGEAIDQNRKRFEAWRNNMSIGMGAVSDIRAVASAWQEMQDGIDPGEAWAFFEAMDRGIANILDRGVENVRASFGVMRQAAQNLFDAGTIDTKGLQELMNNIDAAEQANGHLIRAAEQVETEIGAMDSTSATASGTLQNHLTPSVYGVGTAADTAAGQVYNLTGAIQTAQTVAAQGIHVNISTGSSVGGALAPSTGSKIRSLVTSGQRNALPGGDQLTSLMPKQPSTRPGTTSTGGDTLDPNKPLVDATKKQEQQVKDLNDSLKNVINNFGPKSRGGGGGGRGGREREDKMASIEEIRAFFQQVNAAILSGIRGGTVYSMAGNAIPLGGPGQFVSSEGGTLIEQVNLRGVWDFADPAAKREIVRQLREALKEMGDEVA